MTWKRRYHRLVEIEIVPPTTFEELRDSLTGVENIYSGRELKVFIRDAAGNDVPLREGQSLVIRGTDDPVKTEKAEGNA